MSVLTHTGASLVLNLRDYRASKPPSILKPFFRGFSGAGQPSSPHQSRESQVSVKQDRPYPLFSSSLTPYTCDVYLFCGVDRIPVDSGQASRRVALQAAFAAVDDELRVAPELSKDRACRRLAPDYDASPRKTRRLYGVGHARKLSPVRKDENGSAVAGDAPALAKPLRHPPCEGALVLGVTGHRRV